jgi:radical SAM family uncharacterized protein
LSYPDNMLYQVTRPARYTGGEWNSIVPDWDKTSLHIALCYPDVYEIGMSNMALPIILDLLIRQGDVAVERVFAPWTDMEAAMRQAGLPLLSLETKHRVRDFDVIGFSLDYEMSFTNVLNLLDLAQLPVYAAERDDTHPLVIAGGSSCLNPEPMSDFIDLFVLGDGEDVTLELLEHLREWKATGSTKKDLLRRAAGVSGVYVPSLYRVEYHPDGGLKSFTPTVAEARPVITRRLVDRLPPPVTRPIVPYVEIIHDRGAVEIQRGCTRGCRFCQAGVIYRPVRVRPAAEVVQAVGELMANCGYTDISLVSLSSSDYPGLEELVSTLTRTYRNLSLSLPSLRIDNFSLKLMESLPSRGKTGLTFAPEAGSERLRRSINKAASEEQIVETAALAFSKGWTGLKLYFMLGLPGETMEDIAEIPRLVDRIRGAGRARGGGPRIRISLSTFVPKPHTAFQWVAQGDELTLNTKLEALKLGLRRRGNQVSWHEPKVSLIEAVLSRGDRRIGRVIHGAWKLGSTFDGWAEGFKFENWRRAFAEAGLDPEFYARRERPLDESLPWGHVDLGVTTDFLKGEYLRSKEGQTTPDCRTNSCNTCGLEQGTVACGEQAKR